MFDTLHRDAFKIFSGTMSETYTRILERALSDLFDVPGMVDREDFIALIKDVLQETPEVKNEGIQSNIIYARLKDTGWLVEQKSGYKRVVDLDPAARLLLDFLVDMREGRLRSYGGEVVNVLSLLESLTKDPSGRYEALDSAVKASKSFLNHLRSLSANMGKFEEELLNKREVDSIFRAFFEDYIETFLISDFRKLNTSSNPFRFRLQILALCEAFPAERQKMEVLTSTYVSEGKAKDALHAQRTILRDLAFVRSTFENIEGYLSIIHETSKRIEKRIRSAVLFMHQTREGSVTLLEELFQLTPNVPDDTIFTLGACVKTKLPLGDMHSYEDRIAPPEIEAIKITRPAKSPERIAYEKAVARYRERVTVTPNKIETYLQHHMNDQGEIKGSDLPINSLDDFFIFERLRSLEFLEGGVLASDWSVDQISGRIDNEWISCRDFLIRRAA